MITSGKVKGGRNADYRWVNVAESNGLANPRFTHPAVLKVGPGVKSTVTHIYILFTTRPNKP